MIKYRCLIHPSARILFIKNIKIGKGTIIGKCDIIAQNKGIHIGKNCLINDYVILNSKANYIKIGDDTTINSFTKVIGNGGVTIGKGCSIASGTIITNNHIIPKKKNVRYDKLTKKRTKIGNYVWICANVVIIDGVNIGNNCVIGANSFVNKSFEEGIVLAGTPAKEIRKR